MLQPANTYIHQLSTDTGYRLEYSSKAIGTDGESETRKSVRSTSIDQISVQAMQHTTDWEFIKKMIFACFRNSKKKVADVC